MADGIFKNNGKISTKCPPTNFRVRRLQIYCQIYEIQYGGFSKITVKLIQNVHPRISGIADYEFIVRFTKLNMADPRWRMEFSKITVKSVQNVHSRVFGVADYELIIRFLKFNMADPRWRMRFL